MKHQLRIALLLGVVMCHAATANAQSVVVLSVKAEARNGATVTFTLASGTIVTIPASDIDAPMSALLIRAVDSEAKSQAAPPQRQSTARPGERRDPAPVPPVLVRESPIFINGVQYRVTEQNAVFWRFSWQASIRNTTDRVVRFNIEVQFQDADGFILDRGREYNQVLKPNEEQIFKGDKLLTIDVAPRATKANLITTGN